MSFLEVNCWLYFVIRRLLLFFSLNKFTADYDRWCQVRRGPFETLCYRLSFVTIAQLLIFARHFYQTFLPGIVLIKNIYHFDIVVVKVMGKMSNIN